MAKELPYFKFEPGAWESGMIQACDREAKGLFIDLCSLYWSRLGELPYAFALQKLCNGNEDAMQPLSNLDIFTIDQGMIVINFLDEQLSEFQDTSEKRRNAANKRWENANAYASAKQVQSKSNAIREDKKRKDKKREEEIIWPFDSENFISFWDKWKEYKKQEHSFRYKSKVSEQAALKNLAELSGGAEEVAIKIIIQSIENGWKGFFNLKQNGKNRLTDQQKQFIIGNKDI